jgi:hypothetical protein
MAYAPPIGTRNAATYDNLLLLKDAGAVTADGAGTVNSAARVLDLGLAVCEGEVRIDISAFDFTTGDETARAILQGSNDIAFGSGIVELASLNMPAASGLTGRVMFPFTNVLRGTIYQYVRIYFDVGGTTPSINCIVYLTRDIL